MTQMYWKMFPSNKWNTEKFNFILHYSTCTSKFYSSCFLIYTSEPSWSWWYYGSWIYNYLGNSCLLPLKLWVQIPLMARCSWYNIMCKVCWWFFPDTLVSSTNKTDRHDITEILLKVALNTINHNSNHYAYTKKKQQIKNENKPWK